MHTAQFFPHLFTTHLDHIQRSRLLERFPFLQEGYLPTLDGSEYFESESVSCGGGIPAEIPTERSFGFGLRLIRSLTKQLKATMSVENDDGVRFVIQFKIRAVARGRSRS